jgi:hypothetical protein
MVQLLEGNFHVLVAFNTHFTSYLPILEGPSRYTYDHVFFPLCIHSNLLLDISYRIFILLKTSHPTTPTRITLVPVVTSFHPDFCCLTSIFFLSLLCLLSKASIYLNQDCCGVDRPKYNRKFKKLLYNLASKII